jgi:hypothetical protein
MALEYSEVRKKQPTTAFERLQNRYGVDDKTQDVIDDFNLTPPQKVSAKIAEEVTRPKQPVSSDDTKKDDSGFLEKAGDVGADIGLQFVGGVRDAVQEFGETGLDLAQGYVKARRWVNENIFPFLPAGERVKNLEDFVLNAELPKLPEVPEAETTIGNLTRGVSQFLTGFIPALKAFKVGKAVGTTAKVLKTLGAGITTDFTVFDPQAERLSNFLEEFPILKNPVTKYLAADPEDTDIEGRFKNVLEGIGMDIALGAAFAGTLKMIRASKRLRGLKSVDLDKLKIKDISDETVKPLDIFGKEADKLPTSKEIKALKKELPELEKLTDEEILAKKFLRKEKPLGFDLKNKKTKETLNINLGRLESEKDINKLLIDVAEIFKDDVTKATRGVKTHAVTEALADDLGLTAEELLTRKAGEAFNAEQVVSARKLLVSSSEKVLDLANKVLSPEATDVDRLVFRKATSVHAAIQNQVSGLTAEAGRALNAFNIVAKSKKEQAESIDALLKSFGGRGTTDDLARAMMDVKNNKQLNKLIQKTYNATTSDMVFEYWQNSILSGIITQVVNAASNTANLLIGMGERVNAGILGKFLHGDDKVLLGEGLAQGYGLMAGINDAWKMAKEAFKSESFIDPFTKIESARGAAITAENLSRTFLGKYILDPTAKKLNVKTLKEGGILANTVDLLGSAIRTPGFKMLNSADNFFKGINYRMELQAQAYRRASQEGLTGKNMYKRIAEIVENPPEDIRLESLHNARVNTFTNPNKLASWVNKAKVVPGMRYIIPFVNTPTNIIKFGLERTPFALLSSQIRSDIVQGGVKGQLALSRITTGTMAVLGVYNAVKDGRITGGPPEDKGLREIWMQENQPYSLVFEKDGKKTFVSYNRLEPLGMIFGFAADMANIIQDLDEKEASDLAGSAVLALSRNVTSKTWLKNFSEALDLVSGDTRNFDKIAKNIASGFVPNLINTVNRTFIDPTLREGKDIKQEGFLANTLMELVDEAKRKVPGLSKDLPARRNLWGEIIESRAGFNDSTGEKVFNFLSPAYVSKVEGDKTNEYLIDKGIGINMPRRAINFRGVNIPLTAIEYNRYVELSGKDAKIDIDSLVNASGFKDMPLEIQENRIKTVLTLHRLRAKNMLLSENPEIMNRGEELRIEKLREGETL